VSLKILLADDVPAVRKHVKVFLETEGFKIVGEAADGQEAVRLTQALDPEMAILDLTMPTLNGLDAARDIRALHPGTQVILLTGDYQIYQIVSALRMGVRGFVAKADIPEDLVRAIREVSRGGVFLSLNASRVMVEAYLAETTRPI
jgi:DNA-binding NarL/FixJ family response regulator